MELKDYIQTFKKYTVFILILTAIGGLLAFVITSNIKPGYALSQTFFISSPASTEETNLSQNPDYFAQEKARNFTDTAVAILDSQDFKSLTVKEGQSLSVRKLSPQVIRLTTTSANPQETKTLMQKIPQEFNSKLSTLQPGSKISIKELAPVGQPSLIQADRRIFTLGGLALGFTLAIFALSLKLYLKS